MALRRVQLDRIKKSQLWDLTIVVTLGMSRTLLVISQDGCDHELSPLINGLFAQRRNIPVEI